MHSDYITCPLLSCKGLKSKQVCYFTCEWFKSGKCDTIRMMWNGIGYEQPKKGGKHGKKRNGDSTKKEQG